jgi:tetratricopeptide (TPR) repeat protein
MKKIFSILFVFIVSISNLFSQLTQAEIDKMMKEAKAETEKMKKDPEMKELMKDMPDMDSMMKIMGRKEVQAELKKMSPGIASTKLPAKNDRLINALPKQVLSRQQLITFLTILHTDLQKRLPADKVKSAKTIISKLNKNAAQIALVGAIAWYKKAPSEAALLLTYAASQFPDDNTLNNCGAILNLCGLEEKAIPLLKYALANQPTNTTLLNNIGQAYTGLGATDFAMYYFMRCIRQNSSHPDACATVAYIEYEKGNIEKAQQYAEQSLKGGYSSTIVKFYRRIKKDAKLYSLLKNKLSEKKYFDFNGLTFPSNRRNWEQSEEVYAKQQLFIKKIDGLMKQFSIVITTTSDTANWKYGPLYTVAQELVSELSTIHTKQWKIIHTDYVNKKYKYGDDRFKEVQALACKFHTQFEEYSALYRADKIKGDVLDRMIYQNCLDRVALDNKYFEIQANLIDKYKNARLEKEIEYYDNMMFLSRLTAGNENDFKRKCAFNSNNLLHYFKSYVDEIADPSHNHPNCTKLDPAKSENSSSPVFDQAKCPIDIEVPFGVGKMKLNCQRFEFEVGEGIILTYEKNFSNRESTIAVGIGVASNIPYIEFGAKEQFFIKFDKHNQPIDIGALWETEFDVKGLATPEIKTGFTIGINSGYNFQPGILQGILN